MLVSIIIPLASDENQWHHLLSDLYPLKDRAQIIIVYQHDNVKKSILAFNQKAGFNLTLVQCQSSRAKAMNLGANSASTDWLWFIHADTRIPSNALSLLLKQLTNAPSTPRLFYFWLNFNSSNTILNMLMIFNSLGLKLRSRYLLSPFGDQAFCIHKHAFMSIGQYPTHVGYGEDHCLVWSCHLNNIPVTAINTCITTSARKYQQGGWLKITGLHVFLWLKQWLPLYSRYLNKQFKQFITHA